MKIQTINHGDTGYYARGHHDVDEFLDELALFVGYEAEDCQEYLRHAYVYYTWLRLSPCNWSDEYVHSIEDGTPGKQGTFPATVYERPNRHGESKRSYREYARMPE